MYKFEYKKNTVVLFLCLAIFMLVCIGTSIYYGNSLLLGDLEKFDNDDVKYLRSAQTLIETGRLTYKNIQEPTAFIMPGFVFMLSGFVYVFGFTGAIVAYRIFSAILQTFSMYVIYLIARKVFKSEKIALITVILNLLYVANIYVTTLLLSETVFFSLLVNLIYVCIFAVEERKIKYYVIGGIIWAVSILFKPIMLVFPIIIFILMLINKYSIKEMIKYAIIPIILVVIFLTPWVIRNYVTFDRLIVLTLSSGNPKLQGAYIGYNQEVDYISKLDLSDVGHQGTEIETNEMENNIANKIIKYNFKNNFWQYMYWMTIGKTFKNFNFPFLWYPLYGISYIIQAIVHYIFLILGLMGIILSISKKENNTKYYLISIIIFFNVVHLPYYCFARYVYPIMPIVIIFASYAIEYVIDKIKKEKNLKGGI